MRKLWSMWSSLPAIIWSAIVKQVDVVGFHQRVDLAEGEEVVAGVEPEHGEHRLPTRRSGRATGPSPTIRSGRG